MPSATQTARQLLERINAHDVEGIAALLTPDHRFIDSLGAVAVGREMLREGWRHYFRLVPDYRIEVDHSLEAGAQVVFLATACGTYAHAGAPHPQDAWRTPAALRALVRGTLVAEWQVYADNEPLRHAMARAAAAHS